MPTPPSISRPWYQRSWGRLKSFWRTDSAKIAVVRDVLVAAFFVGLLLFAIWGYTGQPFPSQAPLVVVESGSMMHGPWRSGQVGSSTGWSDPSFGRIGTIDPGDLVFVKNVRSHEDVETAFGSGKRSGYGGHGDVIVYRPGGSSDATPIIHRAMLLVLAEPEGCTPGVDCTYRVPEACGARFAGLARNVSPSIGALCAGTNQAITMTLERDGLSLSLSNYPCDSGCGPVHSGYLTRGDNNLQADQFDRGGQPCISEPRGGCISPPIRLDWIIGKSRGEVPWFGLIKLAIYGNTPTYQPHSDPTGGANWQVLRATAPWDLWVSLFLALGVIVAAPIGLDFARNRFARRRKSRPTASPRPPKNPNGG